MLKVPSLSLCPANPPGFHSEGCPCLDGLRWSSTKTTSQHVFEGFCLAEQALLHRPSPRTSQVAAVLPEGQWPSKGWHWGIESPACSPQAI